MHLYMSVYTPYIRLLNESAKLCTNITTHTAITDICMFFKKKDLIINPNSFDFCTYYIN